MPRRAFCHLSGLLRNSNVFRSSSVKTVGSFLVFIFSFESSKSTVPIVTGFLGRDSNWLPGNPDHVPHDGGHSPFTSSGRFFVGFLWRQAEARQTSIVSCKVQIANIRFC